MSTVTGTIHDPNGQAFANGAYRIEFVPTSGHGGQTPNVNGVPVNVGPFIGALDASGAFSQALTDNSTISPAGSKWKFSVVSLATAPAASVALIIVGANVDVSALINTVVPAIIVNSSFGPPFPNAYSDTEIIAPISGSSYYNLTTRTIRVYDAPTATWLSSGTGYNGDPIAGFNANVQSAFVAGPFIAVTGASLNRTPFNVGFQGVAQGTNANGGFGIAANDATTNNGEVPTGLGGSAFLSSTVDNTGESIGVEGDGFAVPAITKTINSAAGLLGIAHNIGPGIVTTLRGVEIDTAENSAGGTVTNNFGVDVFPQQSVGTLSAAFHAADQGSGANNYGIKLDGACHNDLGSGLTKAGSFQSVSVAFASLPSAVGLEGAMRGVTDSNTNVWGAIIAGGGANHVLAYSNGTNWTVAGK